MKACGQQVGLPDEAFYFLNLATLGEPDVTVGHSSPASHLVSASQQLLTSMPSIPDVFIRKEGIMTHI